MPSESAPPGGGHPPEPPGAGQAPHHHFLEQAPVPALDVDGLNVVSIGTVLFAVASVLAAVFYPRLSAAGNGWWLGVCVSGFLLGLIGLAYCFTLRSRRRLKGERTR